MSEIPFTSEKDTSITEVRGGVSRSRYETVKFNLAYGTSPTQEGTALDLWRAWEAELAAFEKDMGDEKQRRGDAEPGAGGGESEPDRRADGAGESPPQKLDGQGRNWPYLEPGA